MQYTREQKRDAFEALPNDLREAILSVETIEKLEKISNDHSLMLDKAGELNDETTLFMLGLTRQEDFVKNISKRLEISYEKAQAIASDVNKEILDAVRSSLQEIQSRSIASPLPKTTPPEPPQPPQPLPNPNLSSLEKVGNFTIEKPGAPSNSPQYEDKNLKRESVLENIENPPVKSTPVSFVDHLLTKPTSSVNEVKKDVQSSQKKYTIDPYREQI